MAPPLSPVSCPSSPCPPKHLPPVPPQHLNPKGVARLVAQQPIHRSLSDPFSGLQVILLPFQCIACHAARRKYKSRAVCLSRDSVGEVERRAGYRVPHLLT